MKIYIQYISRVLIVASVALVGVHTVLAQSPINTVKSSFFKKLQEESQALADPKESRVVSTDGIELNSFIADVLAADKATQVGKILGRVSVESSQVTAQKNGFTVDTTGSVDGKKVDIALKVIWQEKGFYTHHFRIAFPEKGMISSFFPTMSLYDFIPLKELTLAIGTHKEKSDAFGEIPVGITLLGKLDLEQEAFAFLTPLLGDLAGTIQFRGEMNLENFDDSQFYIYVPGEVNLVKNLVESASLELPEFMMNAVDSLTLNSPKIELKGKNILFSVVKKMLGVDVKLDVKVGGDTLVKVYIAMPEGWKPSTVIPGFKMLDFVSFEKVGFAIASQQYEDSDLGVSIVPGVNLVGTLSLKGPVGKLLSGLTGKKTGQLSFGGVIKKDIKSSYIEAGVAGKIPLFDRIEKVTSLKIPTPLRKVAGDPVFDIPKIRIGPKIIRLGGERTFYAADIEYAVQVTLDKENNPKLQLIMMMPNYWSLAKLFPQLKVFDFIKYKKLGLIISESSYKDEKLGLQIQPGINMFGTLSLGDISLATILPKKLDTVPTLKALLSRLIGQEFNLLSFHGIINPLGIGAGSAVYATIGKDFNLIPALKMNGRKLGIVAKEMSPGVLMPVISLEGGFELSIPQLQKNPINFSGAMTFMPPTLITLWGKMDGQIENIFDLGISLGDGRLGASTDPALWAAGLPISGLQLGYSFGIGRPPNIKKVKVAAKGGVTASGALDDFIFDGNIPSGLTLEDIVEFFIGLIEKKVQIFEKLGIIQKQSAPQVDTQLVEKMQNVVNRIQSPGGRFVDVKKIVEEAQQEFEQSGVSKSAFNIALFKKILFSILPPVGIGSSARLVLSYKDGDIAGDWYSMGVTAYINNLMLGNIVNASFKVIGNKAGVSVSGELKPFKVGPLSITGVDKNDPAHFDATLSLAKQLVSIDGRVTLDILGGISFAKKLYISPFGIEGTFDHKIFDKFATKIEFQGGLGRNFVPGMLIRGSFKQTALKTLSTALTESIVAWVNKAKDDIAASEKQALTDIDTWVANKTKEVDDKIARVEQEIEQRKKDCAKKPLLERKICASALPVSWVGRKIAERNALLAYRKVVLKEIIEKAGKTGVKIGTKVAHNFVQGIGIIPQFLHESPVIILTDVQFEGSVDSLFQGELPRFTIRGTVGGKPFEMNDLYIDFKNFKASVQKIVESIVRVFAQLPAA